MPKRSVVAAVISVLLCVGPAVAAGEGPADQGELLVSSICRLVDSSGSCAGSSGLVSDPADLAGKQLPAQRVQFCRRAGGSTIHAGNRRGARARRSLRSRSRDPESRLAVGRASAAVRQSRPGRGSLQRRPCSRREMARRRRGTAARNAELCLDHYPASHRRMVHGRRHEAGRGQGLSGCVLRAEHRRRPSFGTLDNRSFPVLGPLGGPDSRQLQQERGACRPICAPEAPMPPSSAASNR